MQIICPKCEFAREVADDQIPPRSVVATCPQCGLKFRFRELPDEHAAPQDGAPAPSEPGAGADVVPPGTYGPDGRTAERLQQPERKEKPAELSAAERYLASKHDAENGKGSASGSPGSEPSGSESPGPVQVEVPFEDLENFGFFSGMAQTIRRACFSPRLFFSVMPLRGLVRPLVFGLLVVEFMFVVSAFWQLSGVPDLTSIMMEHQGMQPPSAEQTLNPLTLFVVMPLGYVFNLLLSTLVVHAVLAIVGGAKRGFEGSFRVMAYAYAPLVLGAVPFGLVPAAFWSLAISIIGLKHMHSTDYARSVLAHVAIFLIMALLYFVPMFPAPPAG